MTIGFDLDGVLLAFHKALTDYHNKRYGTNHEFEQLRESLPETWNCTEEESVKRVFEFYLSEDHWNTPPIDGAVEAIKKLKSNHNLIVITSKPEELKEKTHEWFNKYFPEMFDKVYFTNQYYGNGYKRTKGEVCIELGIDLFIDDMTHNVNDVVSSGIPVLLFDSPWNKDYEISSHVKRVHSWDEIVNHILKV